MISTSYSVAHLRFRCHQVPTSRGVAKPFFCEDHNVGKPTKCSDSEPILEIEIASANYCQVTGGTVSARKERERRQKGGNRKEAEIVPLHSNSSCERREDGCLHKSFMRLLIKWRPTACAKAAMVALKSQFLVLSSFASSEVSISATNTQILPTI